MILVARPIENITINGNEWLLAENGNPMQFINKETACEYLKMNGFSGISIEELEDSFLFEEID